VGEEKGDSFRWFRAAKVPMTPLKPEIGIGHGYPQNLGNLAFLPTFFLCNRTQWDNY
jgi:hypothetical protein